MNKKKSLKGFTLIELIIVLAIFSVIMTLVMSFIDPVSRLMTKTSIKERTSAYVDNIDEYISKSIRYAQNINVYEHGFYNADLTSDECTEERIVRDFVDSYYDGGLAYKGIDSNGKAVFEPLTGKVHVLKLINTAVDSLESGHIYETVYTFTAGRGEKSDDNTKEPAYLYKGVIYKASQLAAMPTAEADNIKNKGNKCPIIDYHDDDSKYTGADKFHHATISLESPGNVDVINPEHFKEYNYYYKLGMCTFEPLSNEYFRYDGLSVQEKSKFFYSALKETDNSITSSMYNFPISVVTYKKTNSINKENEKEDYTYKKSDGSDVTTKAFGSPSAMSSLGISFKNAQMQTNERTVKYYREQIDIKYKYIGDVEANGIEKIESVIKTDDENNVLIEPVTRNYITEPFELMRSGYSDIDNIYFVYTVPDEINDTEWKIFKEPTATTTTTS